MVASAWVISNLVVQFNFRIYIDKNKCNATLPYNDTYESSKTDNDAFRLKILRTFRYLIVKFIVLPKAHREIYQGDGRLHPHVSL